MNPQRHLSTCPPADCEAQYNLQAAFPDFPDVLAGWRAASARTRQALKARIEAVFLPDSPCRLDLFPAARPGSPLLVFMHGGYWQGGDKDDVAFLAAPFVANGIAVAIPNYDLAPAATIETMLAQTRAAFVWLWRHGASHGIDVSRMYAMGHSAGGQLAAMMLTDAWGGRRSADDGDEVALADLIRQVFAISGVFDLQPLIATSLNRALALTPARAEPLSPVSHERGGNGRLTPFVGEHETREFHAQARLIQQSWPAVDAPVVVPGVHHYTILNRFGDAGSAEFRRVRDAILAG